jgi:hypothetical protein
MLETHHCITPHTSDTHSITLGSFIASLSGTFQYQASTSI